jgi:hypothetical protein
LAWSFQITFLPTPIDPPCEGRAECGPCLEVLGGESELGQNFLMRNALATVKGGARRGNLTGFFLSDRLIIQRSVGETAGQRIGHHLEQMNNGGELASIELVQELVRLLLFFIHGCHQEQFTKQGLGLGARGQNT